MSSENPYRSPEQAQPPILASYAPSLPTLVKPFQSLQGLGAAVKALLGTVAFAKMGAIAASVWLVSALSTVGELSSPQVQLPATLQVGIVVLGVLLSMVAGVVYLIWLYRAYQNLPALGVGKLEASPGWAVGYYFIPFLNLVRPYQTMVEIVRGSAPQTDAMNGNVRTSIVGWWWAGWILAGVLGQVSGVIVQGDAPDLATLRVAGSLDVAMHLISLLTAILAIRIVHRVTSGQEEKSRVVRSLPGQPPAFPPVANAPFAAPAYAPAPAAQENPFSDFRGP